MLSIGQLVRTHNTQSAQLFIDEFAMHAEWQKDSLQRHDEFMARAWRGLVRLFRRRD